MSKQTRVLDDVQRHLQRFVSYPTWQAPIAHTLWVAHAHLFDRFDHTPRLAFISAEPGSGKTRGMEVTEPLVPHPLSTVNTSTAALFAAISQGMAEDPPQVPTVFLDETDAIFGPRPSEKAEELRGLLNAGHKRGGTVLRVEMVGNQRVLVRMHTYAPLVLAGLHGLPDTLTTRSIIISMKRARPEHRPEPYRDRLHRPEAEALRRRLEWLAGELRTEGIGTTFPELPETITGRDADKWEVLVAVADAVGGHWPDLARRAAERFVAASSDQPATLGVQLLHSIRRAFDEGNGTAIRTADLVASLNQMEGEPWAEYKGDGLTAHRLAGLLRQYEIKPDQYRLGGTGPKVRGYRLYDFEDAFARYLPAREPEPGTSGTPGTSAPGQGSDDDQTGTQTGTDPVQLGTGSESVVPVRDSGNGTEQPRKHGDVPLVTDVPGSGSRGERHPCPTHGTEHVPEGCCTCSEICGDPWAA